MPAFARQLFNRAIIHFPTVLQIHFVEDNHEGNFADGFFGALLQDECLVERFAPRAIND